MFKLSNLMLWGRELQVNGKLMEAFWNKLINDVSDPALWTKLLFILIQIIVIFTVGRIIVKVANKAIEHMMIERKRSPLKFDPRRTNTIGRLIRNVISYAVNFISILLILLQMGLNLAPVLAGAGVLGLAIGFGAQSLVKDVITGFFIIFEDQFAVGDVIQTRTFKGTVEEIGLRVTRIKSGTGEVFIIPNGSIQEVTNYSVYNSVAIIDIAVAYEEDTSHVLEILKETMKEVYATNENMVKFPEVLGVESLGPTEAVLRVQVECKANTQGAVTRIVKEELKKALEHNKIAKPH